MIKYFLLLAFIMPLMACQEDNGKPKIHSGKTETLVIESANGQSHAFKVELARTIEEVTYGLMDRETMPEDHGMLFYFGGEEAERRFWMKNTLIPLDMIFIKADGTIHKIHDSAIPGDLKSIPSYGAVGAVLEINGGIAKELDLKVGDNVSHRFFK